MLFDDAAPVNCAGLPVVVNAPVPAGTVTVPKLLGIGYGAAVVYAGAGGGVPGTRATGCSVELAPGGTAPVDEDVVKTT